MDGKSLDLVLRVRLGTFSSPSKTAEIDCCCPVGKMQFWSPEELSLHFPGLVSVPGACGEEVEGTFASDVVQAGGPRKLIPG